MPNRRAGTARPRRRKRRDDRRGPRHALHRHRNDARTANIALVREAVLCLINRERAEHARAAADAQRQLQAAAESHSAECSHVDYFAHVSPDGETPVERIQATGYIPSPFDGYVLGENLAWGTYELGTPKAIVAAWIASPGHLANILEARYTETGIGVDARPFPPPAAKAPPAPPTPRSSGHHPSCTGVCRPPRSSRKPLRRRIVGPRFANLAETRERRWS